VRTAAGNFEDILIQRFRDFLRAYDLYCPFTKYGQLEYHVATIDRRRQHRTARAALEDREFRSSLYDVLRAWQIGTRRSNLKPFRLFEDALLSQVQHIQEFDGLAIDNENLNVRAIASRLAALAQNLGIVENKNRVVAGSKALHHILPDLVVPIDRAYTQEFFEWPTPRFQYNPESCFIEAFEAFARIARATDPVQYVATGWYTSRSKVIDNAIVGFWCFVKAEVKRHQLTSRSTGPEGSRCTPPAGERGR
jgi:hypothetical protein